ncbi:MAG: Sec-independent protein translocase subunit TatA [Actinomycetales bacterium]|nr:Sec-independent protein translocase subunit TatA [Actinomycetales bacterium]
MRSLGGPEILLLLAAILLLFGAKRLPDAARGLGRSLRILKAETRGMTDEPRDEAKGAVPEDGPRQP